MNTILLGSEQAEAAELDVRQDRRSRWCELGLVMLIAFVPLLVNCAFATFSRDAVMAMGRITGAANYRYFSLMVHEIGALLLVVYVLQRTGRQLRSIGMTISITESLMGVGLAVACMVAYYVSIAAVQFGHLWIFGNYPVPQDVRGMLAGGSATILIPFMFLNAFFEETVVRGFFTTELAALSGSVTIASVASVLLQVSYHLYQGWLAAVGVCVVFAVLAMYYARTRKLFPVIVAHLVLDMLAVRSLIR